MPADGQLLGPVPELSLSSVLSTDTPLGGRTGDPDEPSVAAEIALPDPAELEAQDAAAGETQRAAADIERAASQIAAAASELLEAVKSGAEQRARP